MTNAEKLREAARLIAEVLPLLDIRQEICASCGHKSKMNWSAHQLHERLEPIVARLNAAAGSGAIEALDSRP